MAKYVCSVCGYIYDEAKGIPEAGIAPGTKWEELPEDWICPICGASKPEFKKQGDPVEALEKKPVSVVEPSADMREMTPLEVSALCTNLARGCEKQYKPEQEAQFRELAEFFKSASAQSPQPIHLSTSMMLFSVSDAPVGQT